MDVATPNYQNLWVDIDQLDGCDPLACAHIANDIMANLFRAEVRPSGPTPCFPAGSLQRGWSTWQCWHFLEWEESVYRAWVQPLGAGVWV